MPFSRVTAALLVLIINKHRQVIVCHVVKSATCTELMHYMIRAVSMKGAQLIWGPLNTLQLFCLQIIEHI